MKPHAVFLFVLVPCFSALAETPNEAPKNATVNALKAYVRSGPGEAFFPTVELSQGATVDVYRMTRDGWCGIRPPQGSFSWVREDHIRRSTERPNLVTVEIEGAATRVGSPLVEKMNVEYTRLRRGEVLQIVGPPMWRGSQRWLRVAPPSGEFRWIHQGVLQFPNAQSNASSAPLELASAEQHGLAIKTEPIPDDQTPTMQTTAIEPEPAVADIATAPAMSSHLAVSMDSAPSKPTSNKPLQSIMGRVPTAPMETTLIAGPESNRIPQGNVATPDNSTDSQSIVDSVATSAMAPARFPTDMTTVPIPKPTPETPPDAVQDQDETDSSATASNQGNSAWTSVATTSLEVPVEERELGSPSDDTTETPQPMPQISVASQDHPPTQAAAGASTSDVGSASSTTVAEIDAALSQAVQHDISTWDLSPLHAAASQLIATTNAPRVKYRAQQLRQRIDRFIEVQRRHFDIARAHQELATGSYGVALATALAPLNASPTGVVPHLIDSPPIGPSTTRELPSNAPSHVAPAENEQLSVASSTVPRESTAMPHASVSAHGMIVPVQSSNGNVPKFALTDRDGSILFFLSATPTLDLRQFQRQHVTVVGTASHGSGHGDTVVVSQVSAATRR